MRAKTDLTGLIILLGGSGSRFGTPLPKQFCRLVGINDGGETLPLFAETLKNFLTHLDFDVVVLAVHPDYLHAKEFSEPARRLEKEFSLQWVITEGGNSRHQSFRNAFQALSRQMDKEFQTNEFRVVIHDANRPFVSREFLLRIKDELSRLNEQVPVRIPVIPMADSVVRVDHHTVEEYPPREQLEF